MTRSKILAGAVAGLIGGVVFGIMMQMMRAPTPDGGEMPMMAMVAMVVDSTNLAVGWLYHLFNSAVIGALFGWLLGDRARVWASGVGWGIAWGIVWWVLGGLVIMPMLLGMPPFAALRMPPMRPVAFGSLGGHVLYGLVLGLTFVRLRSSSGAQVAAHARVT